MDTVNLAYNKQGYAKASTFHMTNRCRYSFSNVKLDSAETWRTAMAQDWERQGEARVVSEVERMFRSLAAKWREERSASSTMRQEVNDTYLDIIGLGPDVIPYILKDLRRTSDHWFIALRAIAKTDPVRPTDRGNIERMRDAWLLWGEQEKYLE